MVLWSIQVRFCNGVAWLLFDQRQEVMGIRGDSLANAKDAWERHVGPIKATQTVRNVFTLEQAARFMIATRISGASLTPDFKQLAAGERDEGRAEA